MSEILPARIQTVIQVGSADISAMMVQVHIDGLKKEEADLLAKHQGHLAEMNEIYVELCHRFEEELEKKRHLIDPLVAAINALFGGKRTIVARVHPYMSVRPDADAWRMFSRYLVDPNFGTLTAPKFTEATWQSSWVLVFEDTVDSGEECGGRYVETAIDLGNEVQYLTVDIPKALRTRINDVIRRSSDNSLQLHTVRDELRDLPSLTQKVQAALTQQLLSMQPDLVRQVNLAISASGGKCFLEVQE